MTAQHTPGPWTAQTRNSGVWGDHYKWEVIGAPGFVPTIARCGLVDAGPATVEANARLISAAPELLEALKACLQSLEGYGYNLDGCCEEARDAIAKAEGR